MAATEYCGVLLKVPNCGERPLRHARAGPHKERRLRGRCNVLDDRTARELLCAKVGAPRRCSLWQHGQVSRRRCSSAQTGRCALWPAPAPQRLSVWSQGASGCCIRMHAAGPINLGGDSARRVALVLEDGSRHSSTRQARVRFTPVRPLRPVAHVPVLTIAFVFTHAVAFCQCTCWRGVRVRSW